MPGAPPTFFGVDLAAQIDPVLKDSRALLWGDDRDVGQAFDGNRLRFFDADDDDLLTLDPATSVLELAFPGAAAAADVPTVSLFRDEAAAGLGALDRFGSHDFVGLDSADNRTTYARVSGRFVFGGDGNECGNLALAVMHNGVLTDLLTVQGDTLGAGIDVITCGTSLTFGTPGDALLVQGNQAAFRFAAGLLAGLFFVTGGTSGFEFRDSLGAIVGKIMISGGLRIPVAGNIDTLTAGTLSLGNTNATLIALTKNIGITDGRTVALGSTTGTMWGTATAQKQAWWGVTPVVQQVLATGAGATVDQVISLLQTLGLCRQS